MTPDSSLPFGAVRFVIRDAGPWLVILSAFSWALGAFVLRRRKLTGVDDRSKTARVSVHIYHYANCGTCKKALKWLDARGVAYTKSDLVIDRISRAKITDLFRRSGLPIARMFNTSGESYRSGNFKERLGAMSQAEALDALAADGKLVKRPILDAGTQVLVGFDDTSYTRALA